MTEARNASLVAGRHQLITLRLRQRRDELGLTQKQIVTRLARCGLQTTNRALSSLERGSGLDVAKLPELATALDCTVTYLLGLTDDPHRWEPDEPSQLPPKPISAQRPSVTAPAAAGAPPSDTSADNRSLILGTVIPERRIAQ
jgi:transcriptional regulator with XRE-family HTH domain